jgi:internalin A
MHSTHQFFLSKRSIYLIVLDSRKDEKIEYWLKHIESFGGESPVIIVINKIDENPSYDVNRKFILGKYQNVIAFHRISCRTEEGLEELKAGVIKSLSEVKHLDTLWRREWFFIKDTLQKTNRNFISYENYIKICAENGVIDEAEQRELLSFLSDLGIMLNYHELALQDTKVLNPRWITNAVYQIINSRHIANAHGLLDVASLKLILDPAIYPSSKFNYIISLMKKFELCYELENEKFLIPDLLGIDEPEMEINPLIRFYIQYSFLPKSIIPRFMVRMHSHIEIGNNWRTGAILFNEMYSSTAIVKSDEEDKKITIQVEGGQARDFFAVIRNTLEDINSSFEKLQFEERLLLPGSPSTSISYSHLLRLEQMQIDEYIPEGEYEPISVSAVLGTVIKTQKEKFEDRIMQHLLYLKEKFDDRQSVIEEANKIIELKPNFAGVGININALVDKIFKNKK